MELKSLRFTKPTHQNAKQYREVLLKFKEYKRNRTKTKSVQLKLRNFILKFSMEDVCKGLFLRTLLVLSAATLTQLSHFATYASAMVLLEQASNT